MQCSTEQLKVAGRIGQLCGASAAADHGDELLALLRKACQFDAAGIVRWDATATCHVGLTSIGYDEGLSSYFADTFPSTVFSERIRGGRFPLRVDDAPHDFRDSTPPRSFQSTSAPSPPAAPCSSGEERSPATTSCAYPRVGMTA